MSAITRVWYKADVHAECKPQYNANVSWARQHNGSSFSAVWNEDGDDGG